MEETLTAPASALRRNRGMAAVVGLLAVVAALAPLGGADVPGRAGVLLIVAALVEVVHGFRRAVAGAQWQAWWHGAVSLGLGVALINAPLLALSALLLLLAGGLILEGLGLLIDAVRRRGERKPVAAVAVGATYLAAAGGLLLIGHRFPDWAIALAVALRIARTSAGIGAAPVYEAGQADTTVIADLGLPETPAVQHLAAELVRQEQARASIDRGWVIGFIVTLFAIHVARMGLDRTVLGVMSPGVAVLGDLFVAMAIAFAVVIPAGVLWRRLTAPIERGAMAWAFAGETPGVVRRAARGLLAHRLRSRVRLRQARYSLRTALGRGLQIGLPAAAVIAATAPISGMSWYFDTENWAAGVWNSWAEQRTDTWRQAMVEAIDKARPATRPSDAYAIRPPGVRPGEPFSFVVIGDPGEGDASQLSLTSSLVDVARRDDVKFVLISSDVVYPTGAMRHYESNFWIPFMGVTKPVYAIPGNHDWYDALEGFAATFFTPETARLAMRARIETDRRLTSTGEATIERLIAQASAWRAFYGVPTQLQQGPFFQFQTDAFALFAIDTGVARRLDDAQMAWLRAALKSAEGKMKMVVLGHPFFAGGRSTVGENKEFAALLNLFREHGVMIAMAGDTHDLEYYRPEADAPGASSATTRPVEMHHFVNGGGGAYLSFGTALDWPTSPDAPVWAFYPSRAAVVGKIEASTPWWKRPAWWWTRRLGAWPFSAEFLAAAFDSNVSPFHQSFVEVRVEPAERRVRIIPFGVRGRLRWSDMDHAGLPEWSAAAGEFVEWVIPAP